MRLRDLLPFGLGRPPEGIERTPLAAAVERGFVPTMEGGLNTSWDLGWWQQDRKPLDYGAGTAIVEACVSVLAQTAAMCPIHHIRDLDKGGTERVKDSRVERVMMYPNSYQTRSDLIVDVVRSLYFDGNAYGVCRRDGNGAINEIHLVDPRLTRPFYDPETNQVFYWTHNNYGLDVFEFNHDTDRVFPARDVLHLKLFTGHNKLIGETPLQAAASAIAANASISNHQAAFFRQMRRPSGVLATELNLTLEQMRELRTAFDEQSKDLDAGGIPILSRGLKWQPMSITSQDAQVIEAFNMTVADVARVFRVPLVLVNDMSGSTFNNAEQTMTFFLASGMGFLLDHLELPINRLFKLPMTERINFETGVLLRSDFEARMRAMGEGVLKGIYSPNEARAREGLPPVEGGDQPRVQQQVVPLNAWESTLANQEPAPAPAPEPEPEPDDEAEEVARAVAMKAIRKAMAAHE